MEIKGVKGNFINIETSEVDLEGLFDNLWGKLSRIHGHIHEKERVEFEGEKAWLVWDSIVWHEVGLLYDEGKYVSLKSGGKEKVRVEFERRLEMYSK